MKKILSIILVSSLIITAFAGCNTKAVEEEEAPLPDTAPTLSLGKSEEDESTVEGNIDEAPSVFTETFYSGQPTTPANITVDDKLIAMIADEKQLALDPQSYSDKSDIYDISFNYYLLPESEKNSATINETIKKHVEDFVAKMTADATAENQMTVDLQTIVTLYNDSVISMTFAGYVNASSAISPSHKFWALNIDLQSNQVIDIGSMVTIDQKFLDEALKYPLKDAYSPELVEAATDTIKNVDITSYSDSLPFYLKEKTIGVSLSVPHAIGDHVEFEMPIK